MEKLLGAFCFIFAARVEGRVYPPATADRAEGEIGPTGPPGESDGRTDGRTGPPGGLRLRGDGFREGGPFETADG